MISLWILSQIIFLSVDRVKRAWEAMRICVWYKRHEPKFRVSTGLGGRTRQWEILGLSQTTAPPLFKWNIRYKRIQPTVNAPSEFVTSPLESKGSFVVLSHLSWHRNLIQRCIQFTECLSIYSIRYLHLHICLQNVYRFTKILNLYSKVCKVL